MRRNGICYDTGFYNKGVSTYELFDPERVGREMRIIREDLHCTAVRITGGNLERLKVAASHAAAAGLEVWLCPFTTELSNAELLDFFAACAEHAERLRLQGAEVVLLTGSEVSLMNTDFIPGDDFEQRARQLTGGGPEAGRLIAAVPALINAFLAEAVRVVRERFGGKVTYASLPFEQIDWTPFDFICTDAGYRSKDTAANFPELIRAFVAQGTELGKPVVMTEFGCTTFQGAADRGSRSHDVIVWDRETVTPLRLDDDYVRDEQEQAKFLTEVLDVLNAEGVDTGFVYVFAANYLPHREGPRLDLDMASAGVVKVFEDRRGDMYPDMPWEPKAAFTALADYYGR